MTRLEKRIEKYLYTPEITMKCVKLMPYKHKESLYKVLKEKFGEINKLKKNNEQ